MALALAPCRIAIFVRPREHLGSVLFLTFLRVNGEEWRIGKYICIFLDTRRKKMILTGCIYPRDSDPIFLILCDLNMTSLLQQFGPRLQGVRTHLFLATFSPCRHSSSVCLC